MKAPREDGGETDALKIDFPAGTEWSKRLSSAFLGDRFTDDMPMASLCRLAHGEGWARLCLQQWAGKSPSSAVQTDEYLGNLTKQQLEDFQVLGMPSWLDAEAVARGQAFLLDHTCELFISLTCILLNGFVQPRFSEVLVLSGYVASSSQTYQRFYSTAAHIWRWLRSPLTDPTSPARASVLRTRALHGFARRWSSKQSTRWDPAIHGVTLSQLDIAFVLLGFSSVILRAFTSYRPFGIVTIDPQHRNDCIQFWRYVGWLLGLQDEFNPCASTALSLQLAEEFYATIVPNCAHHSSEECALMARSTVRALGMYTFAMPADLFAGIMYIEPIDGISLDRSWSSVPAPMRSTTFGMRMLVALRSKSVWLRQFTNNGFLRMLDWGERFPQTACFVGRCTTSTLDCALPVVAFFSYIWSLFLAFKAFFA